MPFPFCLQTFLSSYYITSDIRYSSDPNPFFIGRGDWLGSSVDATSLNGRIKICYYDESIDSTSNWSTRGSSAILGRLFGSF